MRPPASSIWLAFRSSGKRHLLLTGGRGSGKTTMLRALTAFLVPDVPPGVTSWAEPGRGVFLQENAAAELFAVQIEDMVQDCHGKLYRIAVATPFKHKG